MSGNCNVRRNMCGPKADSSLSATAAAPRLFRHADDEMKAPQGRIVQTPLALGGEDHKAFETFDSLEKIVNHHIGVAVVAILDLGAFAKKCVRFVEQKDRATLLCRIEDAPQVLLCLADVFVDDAAQIDAVQVHFQISGQSLGGDERARPVFAREQDGTAFRARQLGVAHPLSPSGALGANGCHDRAQGH